MMRKNLENFELLAPAGSFESLKASFAAGADAAYMGGNKFGARAYADSTLEDRIEEAIDYAHLRDKKLYLTVNTLLKEDEIKKELYSYIRPLYEQGLDAVIVQDMGVMSFLHKEFPELHLHASTQMTITGADGAAWAKSMGAVRIVTAREMSLADIIEIKKNVDIEIETFVHGAMCYCYSGQCLMSSVIGGRSGNRGRCAQPCRLPYDVRDGNGKQLTEKGRNYILSLKDMCTIDMLPELMDAGISSFKIEGRMKNPVYTAGVVSIYRKYMDMYIENGRSGYSVSREDKESLLNLFDRGGQTDGYLKGIKGKSMMALKEKPSYRELDKALTADIEQCYISSGDKIIIDGHAEFKSGEEARISLTCGDTAVTVCGGVVSGALSRPLSAGDIEKRLRKTGGTQYEFGELTVDAGENIFMPVRDINDLRREAVNRLEKAILAKYRRSCAPTTEFYSNNFTNQTALEIQPELNAYVETREQLEAVFESGKISSVYLDSAFFIPESAGKYISRIRKHGLKCNYVMPAVFKNPVRRRFESYFNPDLFDGIAVKNVDEAWWLMKYAPADKLIGDSSLYAYNSFALEFLKSRGINRFVMPLELNSNELLKAGHMNNELVVYGRMPVMVTEQCAVKNTKGCSGNAEVIFLKDRKQMEFPVKNKCAFCYNVIYNSVPTSLTGCTDRIRRLSPSALRLDFTIEDKADVREIIDLFYRAFVLGDEVKLQEGKFTKGHFTRGIE